MKIPFPHGDAIWYGDQRVFGFFRGETFNTVLLSSALMAVEKWLYDKIEKGEQIDERIKQILAGSRSVAFAGLLLTIGKKAPTLLEGNILPLLGTWQFYQWDQYLIISGDPWRISMMNWVSHGEKIYNQVIAWHTLSHRNSILHSNSVILNAIWNYDIWRKQWLHGQHSLMYFCRLLTYPAARPLRTKGILWVRDVLTGETHFVSREEYLEEALLNMLKIFWAEHRKILQDDLSRKEAFLDILTWLVQRQNPGALELQDEFVRSG